MVKYKKLRLHKINNDFYNVYLENYLVFRIEKSDWDETYQINFIDMIKKYYIGAGPEEDIYMIKSNENAFSTVEEAFEHCHVIIKNFVNLFIEETSGDSYTKEHVLSMLVDITLTTLGDEWIPQEDDSFKSYLESNGLLDLFNKDYTI